MLSKWWFVCSILRTSNSPMFSMGRSCIHKASACTLLKKSVLWETQTASETLSETLFGFREGFRTSKAFSKIPYRFPRSRKPLGFREYRIRQSEGILEYFFTTVGNPISIFENHKSILGNRFVRKSRLGTRAGFREYLFGFRVISSETL